MKKVLIFILMSLLLVTSLNAGWKWSTTKNVVKGAAVYAAHKGFKNKVKKIFTKKKVNNKTSYQQNIDLNLKVKDRFGNELSNAARMKKGNAPYIKKNGKYEEVQLHHSKQNDNGPLFELNKKTHLGKNNNNGNKALHPYGSKKHPYYPVDRKKFNKERSNYWKQRYNDLINKGKK